MTLILFSPAKVNLFFRVLHKRGDGYHEIASLYQSLSLGDCLQIARADEDRLSCSDPLLPCDSTNLVLKAASLFRKKTHLPIFAQFHLIKSIPIQAGLGGGSSNAATALWGLNELAGRPATLQDLQLWGAELGSDIPFFFSKGTAYCEGRGEKIQEVNFSQIADGWIVKPAIGLSTPLVYKQTRVDRLPKQDPIKALEKCLFFNDLEYAAFELAPSLASLKQRLLTSGFKHVLMTGSGSAFFCTGKEEALMIPHTQFYRVKFIRRQEGQWYEFPTF